MPRQTKKQIEANKKSTKAFQIGAVTCRMTLSYEGGITAGSGTSNSSSCAEPRGYNQALSALKSKKQITSILSIQNEWPCENCKEFFERKNCDVFVQVTPRNNNSPYFAHWVNAGVIPNGTAPDTPLVLAYQGGRWRAGNFQ